MDHDILEFSQVVSVPITVHWLGFFQIVLDQINLYKISYRNTFMIKCVTYEMSFLNGSSLPDYYGVAEFANDISFVKLVNV